MQQQQHVGIARSVPLKVSLLPRSFLRIPLPPLGADFARAGVITTRDEFKHSYAHLALDTVPVFSTPT
jgi:hypothetical protein